MRDVIFNCNEYKSKNETYKDFYRDIVIKLDAKNNIDFSDTEDLDFHADILYEFLWYYYEESYKYIFVGLDLEKVKRQKTGDDYRWGLILNVMRRFVKEYPNNSLEFRDQL